MDSINGISYYLNKYQTLSNTSQMTFFLSRRQRIGARTMCVQHSPTAAALSTFFLLNHAPNSPQLNELITRFRESQAYSSVSMSRQSKRLKKSRRSQLNSGNVLIQHFSEKRAIFVFPRFATCCISTSYFGQHNKAFFGSLYQNASTYVKVIANHRWDVFLDTVYNQ